MKVLFLDLDGVVNSEEWYEYRHNNMDESVYTKEYPKYEFDPK